MTTPDITGGSDPQESKATRALAESLQRLVHKGFASAGPSGQSLKNFLNGTWLGEPLHVILTDVPVGAWTTALVFDALPVSAAFAKSSRLPCTRSGVSKLAYATARLKYARSNVFIRRFEQAINSGAGFRCINARKSPG
jgi:hypothetical protein